MTIEEKIGQMTQLEQGSVDPEGVTDLLLGSAVSLSSVTITGKQKLKSVQKGGNVHVGATTTPANLSGQLEIYYVDAPANKAVLAIPAPWTSVSPTVARYKNSLAPAGPTPVRTAVISTGRVAKVTGKGLGGLDIATPPGAGGVITVLTVQNAGDASTHRMCSLYALGNDSVITHKVNSTGYKLTLKKGVETACPACADGIKNGNETAIDCGGSCGPCDDGETCNGAADCESGVGSCLHEYDSPRRSRRNQPAPGNGVSQWISLRGKHQQHRSLQIHQWRYDRARYARKTCRLDQRRARLAKRHL